MHREVRREDEKIKSVWKGEIREEERIKGV